MGKHEVGTVCKFSGLTQIGHRHVVMPKVPPTIYHGAMSKHPEKPHPEEGAVVADRKRQMDEAVMGIRAEFQRSVLEWPICPVHGPVKLLPFFRIDGNYRDGRDHLDVWLEHGCLVRVTPERMMGAALGMTMYPGPEMAKSPKEMEEIRKAWEARHRGGGVKADHIVVLDEFNDLFFEGQEPQGVLVGESVKGTDEKVWVRELVFARVTSKGEKICTVNLPFDLGRDLRKPPLGMAMTWNEETEYKAEGKRDIEQIWEDADQSLQLRFRERLMPAGHMTAGPVGIKIYPMKYENLGVDKAKPGSERTMVTTHESGNLVRARKLMTGWMRVRNEAQVAFSAHGGKIVHVLEDLGTLIEVRMASGRVRRFRPHELEDAVPRIGELWEVTKTCATHDGLNGITTPQVITFDIAGPVLCGCKIQPVNFGHGQNGADQAIYKDGARLTPNTPPEAARAGEIKLINCRIPRKEV